MTARNILLESLNDVTDFSSAESHLHYLLQNQKVRRQRSTTASWHQQAQLHAILGHYLANKFPHGSSKRPTTIERAHVLFQLLEHKLYPWIPGHYNSSLEWKKNFAGRGLVTCVPSKYLEMALTNLKGLRTIVGVDLPIHVYYADEEDLGVERRRQIQNISGVFTFSLSRIYPMRLHGFQMKPFAMLASGFAEVIWFDADLVFLVNPQELFDNRDYDETGTVLFHDRTLVGWGTDSGASIDWSWVHDLIGRGSDYLRSSHAFAGEASNIVDSSAIVMHMGRNLLPMLVVAQLNLDPDTYAHVWGDKETFWLAFELLRKPWTMNQWGMSGVTFLQRNDSACSGPTTWGKGQGADLPACGHMGPQDIVQMIHFSESKLRGPAPFTVQPVGYVPALDKLWHATCVQFEADDLKEFRLSQIEVFQRYINLHAGFTEV
ncbi:hypothetical protein ABBQ32_008758 [Trebouxia sp. C0010 RCD-2024]